MNAIIKVVHNVNLYLWISKEYIVKERRSTRSELCKQSIKFRSLINNQKADEEADSARTVEESKRYKTKMRSGSNSEPITSLRLSE